MNCKEINSRIFRKRPPKIVLVIALGLLERCGDETKTATRETGEVVGYEKRSRRIYFLRGEVVTSRCHGSKIFG